jgi:hypothetical protein
MGLGDALYVQSVARHLIEKGESLRVHSAWPDVFRPLGDRAKVVPFSRAGVQIVAHYPSRKRFTQTTQFEDCCLTAGIKERVDLRLDWDPLNLALVDYLRSKRRVLCVQLPRAPMGRKDGFGAELLPDCSVIQTIIDRLQDRFFIVQIGSGKSLHEFRGVDLDLANQTSVTDLIDVATAADAFLGYVSFLVPLAESLNKPAMLVWSRRGLRSGQPYISSITPKKILHKPSSRYVMDDANDQTINESVEALLHC